MSRSYRKHLILKGSGSKYVTFAKNQANRRIRRMKGEIPDGNSYRKIYDSWNICDYSCRYDPNPHYYYSFKTGELQKIEPDPLWKWRCK